MLLVEFLVNHELMPSRSASRRAMSLGRILVNGVIVTSIMQEVKLGDRVEIRGQDFTVSQQDLDFRGR